MTRLTRLLALTFIESLGAVLVQRGVFFFAHERLGLDHVANLWLALGMGVVYVLGALVSHRLCVRFGERRILLLSLLGQIACYLPMALMPGSIAAVAIGSTSIFALNGLKWPVVESYISAGVPPAQASGRIGLFNLSWAASIPLGVAASGMLIAFSAPALFIAPILITAVAIVLIAALESRPEHLPHDSPHRSAEQISRYRPLASSGRWSLLSSYTLLFMLVPLLPQIFQERLGFSVIVATALASMMDLTRLVAFVVMRQFPGWRGRRDTLAVTAVLMPAAFLMVLLGQHVTLVLLGAAAFGIIVGVAYYAALYYAMVVQNASVDAGGGHEARIGLGFALGPGTGLAGIALAGPLGPVLGMLAGLSPVVAVCMLGALLPLRTRTTPPPSPTPVAPVP
jgi:Na+/melibiose symporter-like transporter